MAYQVLARKWRPQDFASVVGQEAVVTALRNAVADGRIAQAYLFSGIRGIGKTSIARVLAKTLNCENDPPSDPCNDCTTCTEIAAGSDLDVLEIDAATYSKVEQVRDLTDSLQYGPARDRYKVVIIDEIHRLSRQAFDALLKIVEEPPEHLVFLFATTEIEAVPATILSRCQSFQFRRVPMAEMVKHLERVSEAEGLGASDHALRLIARAGEGSVRDSIALLDQIATFGGGKVDDDEVGRILGGVDFALFQHLLRSILAGAREEVSEAVRRVESEGWDPRHVYGEFLAYCRDALHLVLDPRHAAVDLPAEEASALAEEANSTGYENMLRLLNLLLQSEMSVRRSESASLALEITLLRAAELPKLVGIEELLAAAGGDGQTDPEPGSRRNDAGESDQPDSHGATSVEIQPDAAAATEPSAEKLDLTRAAPVSDDPREQTAAPAEIETEPERQEPAEKARAGENPATDLATEPLPPIEPPPGSSEIVTRLLERLSYLKQPLAAHLSGAESLSMKQDVLTIATVPGDSILEKTLTRSSNREILDRTLTEMLGPAGSWRLVPGNGKRRQAAKISGAAAEVEAEVAQDPTVQKVLDLFGGQIESIDRRDNSPDQ